MGKVLTRTKTAVRTKVAIALAGGAILAAAAVGVYQVDRASYSELAVPQQDVVTETQHASTTITARGSVYKAITTFDTSVDIPGGGSVTIVLPEGLQTENATVAVEESVFGSYTTSQIGRTVVITRSLDSDPIPAGEYIWVRVGDVSENPAIKYRSGSPTSVAVQYTVVTDGLPDLAVMDIYLENDVISIMLRNYGEGTTQGNLGIEVLSTGVYNRVYTANQLRNQAFMSAGGTTKLQLGAISDTTLITVCIDVANIVVESNEDNNCMTTTLELATVGDNTDDGSVRPETGTDEDEDGEISTTGSITVVSPNGGEIFYAGDDVLIKWSKNSSVDGVSIQYLDGIDSSAFFVEDNTDTEFTWTIPETLVSRVLRLRIVGFNSDAGIEVEDLSDTVFATVARKSTSIPSDPVDNTATGGNVGSTPSVPGTSNTPSAPSTATGFNNLIKTECPAVAAYDINHPCRTVYYHSRFGTRHAFPNEKVFFTWYGNFNSVQIISKDMMAAIPLGSNVTYRPGARMVKFQVGNTVYTVSQGGVLRAIETETVASQLYGAGWNRQIDDISDAFYSNYTFGSPLLSTNDYSVSAALQSAQFINDSL